MIFLQKVFLGDEIDLKSDPLELKKVRNEGKLSGGVFFARILSNMELYSSLSEFISYCISFGEEFLVL